MISGAVWITGAGGLVGSHLLRLAPEGEGVAPVQPLTRSDVDLCDFAAVSRLFAAHPPAAIIHAAARSRAVACQQEPAAAFRENVAVTRHLATLAHGIPFLFLSTDNVFDGRKGNYVESDAVNPLSVYGETKARAEEVVLANPRHTVVRLALNTGTSPRGDRSFTEQMRMTARRGEAVRLFIDEFRTPLPVQVTARALWELLQRDRPGLYHLGGSERLSRFQTGSLVAERWPELRGKLEECSVKDYTGPPRTADATLISTRLQALLSFRLPGLTEWLAAHPEELC